MKKLLLVLTLFLLPLMMFAQISGRIISSKGVPLKQVAVYIENTNLLAFTDEWGNFSIEQPSKNAYIYFSKIGYETKKVNWHPKKSSNSMELILENALVDANIFSTQPLDPFALFVVQAVSRNRKTAEMSKYSVDFYSKASLQLSDNRSKFLGQERKDLNPALDTDSLFDNYFYLSELASTLTFKKPDYFKEKVLGLQESGNNNGLEFLTGTDAYIDLYQKEISPVLKVISPLAPIAPSYYYFQFGKSFKANNNHTIYQIKVTPKRENEPVMEGSIYLVKDTWQLYAVDVKIKAANIGNTKVDEFYLQQHYVFDTKFQTWVKDKQILDLKGKFLVFNYFGSFKSVFKNYKTEENLTKNDFTRELIQYEKDYNKQSDYFWILHRKIPLTHRESKRFDRNELLEHRKVKIVLDSIDKRTNDFTLFKLIKGYEYQNSFKNREYVYQGLLSSFAFNPVQGFNVNTGLVFTQNRQDDRKTELGMVLNYGIEENKPRFSGFASHMFNKKNYNTLNLSGGMVIEQFGQENAPIKNIINSIGGAWFGKNFAKYYQKDFIKISYEQYAFTGFKLKTSFEYANRSPLFNTIQSPPFVPNLVFGSNNPMDDTNYTEAPFETHHIFKFNAGIELVFDQKIISYPNQKQYIRNSKYPVLSLQLEKGLSSNINKYNYTFVSLSTKYNSSIGSIGNISIGFDTGKFIEQNDIAFMDYKHFYGNETPIGSSADYNKQFNLLPYYQYSTRKSYLEYHVEHDFKGFLINKVPLLNKTRYSLILGFHQLNVENQSSYQEYSVGLNNFGFGKFRPFRIDYFRSHYQGGFKTQGVILGIKILDLIQK